MTQVGVTKEWIVLTVHRNQEGLAFKNLVRQNFNSYCPLYVKYIRHARRAYDAERPLFPGYLFVEMPSSEQGLRHISNTVGIRKIVMSGANPARLPPGFVDTLKAREENGVISKPARQLQVGEKVRVQGGAFDGFVADILELKEEDRVLVLLDLLNRRTRVQIGARHLL